MDFFVAKKNEFKTSEIKRKAGKFCCAIGCNGVPRAKKKGLCDKHYARYRKTCDPVYDRYTNFKGNALRRGKEFTITIEEFRKFCADTGYIIKKGMRGRQCTIDRKENHHGYHIWNIQLLTMNANQKKYHEHDKHFTELPETDEDYVPF